MPTRVGRPAVGAVLALAGILAGCPSTTLYRTADPVPRGRWQLAFGASGGALADDVQEARSPTGQGEVGLRRGVSGNADVGVKLFTLGLGVDATLRFVHRGRWSLAFAPEVSAMHTPTSTLTTAASHLFARGSVLATYRTSPQWAFTLAPSVGAGLYLPRSAGYRAGLWLGATVNAEVRVGAGVWLVPEVGGYRVLTGEVPLRGAGFSVGLGLRWAL